MLMYKYNLSLHYLKSPGHVDGFDRQKAHSYTNYIINNDDLNDQQFQVSDLNNSGDINITDIVLLVELILNS